MKTVFVQIKCEMGRTYEVAEHLADDEIVLFPITKDTYAMGSLSEVGFSFLQAVKLNIHLKIL